jgi:polyisoprenoid-binding protein YceI
MRLSVFLVAAAFATACSNRVPDAAPAAADVHRLAAGARVHFTAVKNGDVSVAGTFSDVTGRVDLARFPALAGEIRVNLASAATGVDARDRNVKAYFFEVSGPTGPAATFTPARFEGAAALPAPGGAVRGVLAGRLDFHGFGDDVTLPVAIERDAAGTYFLKSTAPLAFSIGAWNMDDEKATLMEHCHHKSVDDRVLLTLEAAVE